MSPSPVVYGNPPGAGNRVHDRPPSAVDRPFGRMAMVITSETDRGIMSSRYAVALTILLVSALGMAGCTGSPAVPAVTPSPSAAASPVVSTPAQATTAAPVVTYVPWTTEMPAAGHPYSKTYSFHGSGNYEDFTFTTDADATWVFRMDPGPGAFRVSLFDARGNELAVLPPTGTKSVRLAAGDYYFDIAADAPWYITMTTP